MENYYEKLCVAAKKTENSRLSKKHCEGDFYSAWNVNTVFSCYHFVYAGSQKISRRGSMERECKKMEANTKVHIFSMKSEDITITSWRNIIRTHKCVPTFPVLWREHSNTFIMHRFFSPLFCLELFFCFTREEGCLSVLLSEFKVVPVPRLQEHTALISCAHLGRKTRASGEKCEIITGRMFSGTWKFIIDLFYISPPTRIKLDTR